jgi:hypothetical protein
MVYLNSTKSEWYNLLCFILQPFRGIVMNKKGIERNIVVLLFVLVLVVFSFAERDSRKLDKLYTTAQLLKKSTPVLSTVVAELPQKTASNN